MRQTKTLVSLVAAILYISTSLPQVNNVKFEHLTVENGLSQDVVTSILQDRSGFLWFGTQDGLNRYDGYGFTVFKNNPFDSSSLTDAWIQTMAEDKSGNLWIGTQSSGVFRYNKLKGNFTHLFNEPGNKNSLVNNRVWKIITGRNGIIWIGTSAGLDSFNPESKIFTHYNVQNGYLNNNAVNSIYEDKSGALWIGTFGGGLNKLNLEDNRRDIVSYKFKGGTSGQMGTNSIKTIFSRNDSVLWLGTLNGLVKFDKNTGHFSVFFPAESGNRRIPNQNYIMSIADAGPGKLWIGTHNRGLNLFDEHNESFAKIIHNPYDGESLSDNYVRVIYQDLSGNLWVGTGKGINKRIPNSQHFINLKHIAGNSSTLSADEITSITDGGNNVVWIGTWGGGLNRLDLETFRIKQYKYSPSDPASLPDNIIWCTLIDSKNNFWVGSYAGISRFDRSTGKFERKPFGKARLSHDNVSALFEDNKGTLWVGTWGGGLNRYDKSSHKFIYYKNNPGDPGSISDDFITDIYQDKTGNLWIGTNGGGLNKYDYSSGKFHRFIYNPKNKSSLSSNNVRDIFEDNSGKLWIGTWGGGISVFSVQSGTFKSYTEKDGLANNVVYGILQDDAGHLWISTDAGLSRFNPANGHFITYEKKDGTGNYQYGLGYLRTHDGRMIFGGVNGLTIFYPRNITINTKPPQVVFTSFKKFNKELNLGKNISYAKEIKLSYYDNVFSIGFAALDYTRPEKNMYRYKLEGFEKDWTSSGNIRTATYTNLNPGRYVFKVQASNNDNVWNTTGASLIIDIVPPFWATLWFRGAGVLLVIILIFAVYKLRVRSIKRRNLYLQAIVREKTSELENEITVRKETETALRKSEEQLMELNESKDKFFSIISHDLKGPFYALLSHSEYMEEEFDRMDRDEFKTIIGNIHNILKRLSELTDNLLNWSRFKLGRMDFEPVDCGLLDIVDSALSVTEISAKKKDITIENNIDDIEIRADKEMMISVVQNLVTNAVKFSMPGGRIVLSSEIKSGMAEVSVADNGVGIKSEDLDKLFKIDITHTTVGTDDEHGSGLGLIVCKEAVEKNGGKISVESAPGKGSIFTFSVPAA